jgi:hypothetical protein
MQKFTLNLAFINDSFVIETNDTDTVKTMQELDSKLTYEQRSHMLSNILKRIERNYFDFMSGVESVDDIECGQYTNDDFSTDLLQAAYTQQQITQ